MSTTHEHASVFAPHSHAERLHLARTADPRSGAAAEVDWNLQRLLGEKLMALPRVDTERIKVRRGIAQTTYQIANLTKVALEL